MIGRMAWPNWAAGGLRVPPSKSNAGRTVPSAAYGIRDDWTSDLLAAVGSKLKAIGLEGEPKPSTVDAFRFDDGTIFVVIAAGDDLVLPLVVNASHGKPAAPRRIATAAAAHAAQLCLRRERILRRMVHLRRIAEGQLFARAGIVFTALELAPRRMELAPSATHDMYVGFKMTGPSLDTVEGGEIATSAKDLESSLRALLPDQLRRRAQIQRLQIYGAMLETDGISVRAIAGRGLDLTNIVRRTMAGETVELPTDPDGMHFRAAAVDGFLIVEWGFSPRVFVRPGVVEIGHGIPETLLLGATGRPVAHIVDHPFLRDGPVIGSAENADPAECSFLEVVQPALFLRQREDGGVEAFEIQDHNPEWPGHPKELAA